MMDNDMLRASDAERNETAELLRRHHAEGRLDTDELEQRIGRCYAAKTRGELDALTSDLPGAQHRRRANLRRRDRPPRPLLGLVAVAVVIAVSVSTGAHAFWLIWPIAFFVFGPFGRRYGSWRSRSATRTSWNASQAKRP